MNSLTAVFPFFQIFFRSRALACFITCLLAVAFCGCRQTQESREIASKTSVKSSSFAAWGDAVAGIGADQIRGRFAVQKKNDHFSAEFMHPLGGILGSMYAENDSLSAQIGDERFAFAKTDTAGKFLLFSGLSLSFGELLRILSGERILEKPDSISFDSIWTDSGQRKCEYILEGVSVLETSAIESGMPTEIEYRGPIWILTLSDFKNARAYGIRFAAAGNNYFEVSYKKMKTQN
jgi:hypothetical protein